MDTNKDMLCSRPVGATRGIRCRIRLAALCSLLRQGEFEQSELRSQIGLDDGILLLLLSSIEWRPLGYAILPILDESAVRLAE